MTIKKHIFCQCMKPWAICVNKNNSYKLDVRGLIDIQNLTPYFTKQYINYDFINEKWLKKIFECRFRDKKQ
jgi:hypothetical protein